jgi:predicted glycogen debranching enzyme
MPLPEANEFVVATHPGALPADAEWLLTDGAGGYACGSADDLGRRRYHGFWIVRLPGEAKRTMVVAALDERVLLGDSSGNRAFHLLPAHWRDVGSPRPGALPLQFRRRPLPTWHWRGDGVDLERSVVLTPGTADRPGKLLVRYRNRGRQPIALHVRPLLGGHDVDHLPPAAERFDATCIASGASWGLQLTQQMPRLWWTLDGVGSYRSEPNWYRGFVYTTDRDRGYDHVGDRFCAGVVELTLGAGQDAVLAGSLVEPMPAPAIAFAASERAAAAAWREAAAAPADSQLMARLELGADDFFYRAAGGRLGLLAGFPWFGEWGRDVFLALPGLSLCRGRSDLCLEVLSGALPFLRAGLLPNIYGSTPETSHYGSCDAALWFSLCVQRLVDGKFASAAEVEPLAAALADIAAAYLRGTELGLRVDADGLLAAGRPDLNATWMDARTARGPVTPRQGLPVEIQALWYALLAFLSERDKTRWASARDAAGKAFLQQFWCVDEVRGAEYLADRVERGAPDRTVRPNMLVAAALPRSPLSRVQRAAVVGTARRELLTPRGLRTLSPREPGYRGRYGGGIDERDLAYHQGTAWPWLFGFYAEAAIAAANVAERAEVAAELHAWLDGLLPELDRAGIDHISEVFDGDESSTGAPQHPGGTFAQAWNTGELLRACWLVREAMA